MDATVSALHELLERAAAEAGDTRAVVQDDGRTLTYAELHALADAEAAALQGSGVRPGDRVVLRSAGADFAVGFFGASRAGAVVVPVNPALTVRELAAVLAHVTPGVVITRSTDADAHRAAAEAGLAVRSACTTAGPRPEPTARGAEDVAVLCATSGTSTGAPRAAMLSHRSLLANVDQCAALDPAPVRLGDRVLLALPMFHVYGLGPGLLQATAAGATLVVAERFDAAATAALMAAERVTSVIGVPPMYRAWLGLGDTELAAAFADVRLATSGAAPLPGELLAAVHTATGLDVHEGYGLTETGPVLTTTLVGGRVKPGCVGAPLRGVSLRLVDAGGLAQDATRELGEDAGDTGRVSVRGPNLFSGYWPDGGDGPDAHGWITTGDVGFLDADGDLHLIDRTGDLIIVNGFNVYPHEVEHVLRELDGVVDAAVVGVASAETGETVKAVLVAGPGAELDAERVRAHCVRSLARFKVPTVVELVDRLPHSPTGKLARRVLREGAGS